MSSGLQETVESRSGSHHQVHVSVHILGHGVETFAVSPDASLLEVMAAGVGLAGFALLPSPKHPFDRLHAMGGEDAGPVIDHLHQTMEEYLRQPGAKAHFAVELVATFRVNTRWDIAPRPQLSPREILALPHIHLDPTEYTLYLPEKTEPLPLDTPVPVERGAEFEAQRDGRYGGGC